MMTSVELSAIRGRLTALRERLDHCDEEVLVEVQSGRKTLPFFKPKVANCGGRRFEKDGTGTRSIRLRTLSPYRLTCPAEKSLRRFDQPGGMIAEYERAKIMERSRRGKRHAARHGSVNVLTAALYPS